MLGGKRNTPVTRYCKKCPPANPEDGYEKAAALIAEIPAERRTPEDAYRERLAVCRECSELRHGVCQKCGCYVVYRAANRRMYCPAEVNKWE